MRNKYFDPCIVEFHDGALVLCELAKDGLCYLFTNEIAQRLDILYPIRDRNGWFFNNSKDRYIAERSYDGILVNPQFVSKHSKSTLL